MSLYRYPGPQAISQVRFRYSEERTPVALLSAGEVIDFQKLSFLRAAIHAQGWQCVPCWVEQQPVLQVSGFKNAAGFLNWLQQRGFVYGVPQAATEPGDHPKRSFRNLLHHTSLSAAALLNLVGDVGLLRSGIHESNRYHIVAGSFYTAGAASAALFGGVKSERQVNDILTRTTDFLEGQGARVPDGSNLSLARQQNAGLTNFMHRHAAQTMLGMYAAGAGTMLVSGLQMRDPVTKKLNPMRIAYGANSLGIKLAALMLPEKTKEQQGKHEARGFFSRAYHWLIDEPMHLFGVGSFFSDIYLAGTAWIDHRAKPVKKLDLGLWVSTGAYMVADVLAGISSKNPANAEGAFSADEGRRIAASAAEVIARQPQADQQAMVDQVAGYLSQQPEMESNAGRISRAVGEQLAHLKANPWAARLAVQDVNQAPLITQK